ncbi:MAG: hypothetical protein OXI59_08165 [Gemmatimonadota bacterium]|nr:hypothetical protein [Gemmatimonadota bacterium]
MKVRRTFNYTERQRILHRHVDIKYVGEDVSPPKIEISLDLSSYDLPQDANVYVEAFRRNAYMRFHWGQVGNALNPGADVELTESGLDSAAAFRVKVIGVNESAGLILAQTSPIRIARGNETILLLNTSENMGDEIWRLEFDEQFVTLIVNPQLEGIQDQLRSVSWLSAVILTAAIRQILEQMCSTEESGAWADDWEKFVATLTSRPMPQHDAAEQTAWIDAVVSSFSARHGLLGELQGHLLERT